MYQDIHFCCPVSSFDTERITFLSYILILDLYQFLLLSSVPKIRIRESFTSEIFYWRKYPDLWYVLHTAHFLHGLMLCFFLSQILLNAITILVTTLAPTMLVHLCVGVIQDID